MSDGAGMVGIQARYSRLDRNACTLRVMRSALFGGAVRFSPDASDKPLAEKLLALGGVRDVALLDDVVSLAKEANAAWPTIVAPAAAAVRAHLVETPRAPDEYLPAAAEPARPRTDAEVRAAVQSVLDARFNPAIAKHRGAVRLHDYSDGVLTLEMLGGCKGCAASALTLRQGLTSILRSAVPEVREIADVTDHASGDNPFYPR